MKSYLGESGRHTKSICDASKPFTTVWPVLPVAPITPTLSDAAILVGMFLRRKWVTCGDVFAEEVCGVLELYLESSFMLHDSK